MAFAAFALKGLLRQRARTTLTTLGIAIGITTVVALGAITSGLRTTSAGLITAGGADFMVAQAGASDLTFSTVSIADWRALQRRPEIARATGALLEVTKVGNRPYFPFFGYDAAGLRSGIVTAVRGRLPAAGTTEAAVGEQGAKDAGVDVGGTIEAKGMRFRVVGVFHAADTFHSAGAVIPLAAAQRLSGKHSVVTLVHVTLRQGVDPAPAAAAIERDFPELTTVRTVDEYSKVDQGFKMLDAANLAITVIAVGAGGIGVMNTMIMSVFERTREIGILRAVGWRGSRILRMVLTEALLLCLIAALVGIVLGIAASRAVVLVPSISSFLTPAYPLAVFVRALLVGVVVALGGALYPALRAVRLSPVEALRHE